MRQSKDTESPRVVTFLKNACIGKISIAGNETEVDNARSEGIGFSQSFCVFYLTYLGSSSQLLGNFQAHTMDEPYTDQKPTKFHQQAKTLN